MPGNDIFGMFSRAIHRRSGSQPQLQSQHQPPAAGEQSQVQEPPPQRQRSSSMGQQQQPGQQDARDQGGVEAHRGQGTPVQNGATNGNHTADGPTRRPSTGRRVRFGPPPIVRNGPSSTAGSTALSTSRAQHAHPRSTRQHDEVDGNVLRLLRATGHVNDVGGRIVPVMTNGNNRQTNARQANDGQTNGNGRHTNGNGRQTNGNARHTNRYAGSSTESDDESDDGAPLSRAA